MNQVEPLARLDLRGTPCPLNYVRSRLVLEKMPAGSILQVDLDAGEPEMLVSEGLRSEGHEVDVASIGDEFIRLTIRRREDSDGGPLLKR